MIKLPGKITLTTLILLLFVSTNLLKAQKKMEMQSETTVLVLFNSASGGTYKMAKSIAEGIESLKGTKAVLKQIPVIKQKENNVKTPWSDLPYATIEELPGYDGIAFGSPVNFGNMSADMRYFLNQSVEIWTKHKLEGMPATVFMSGGSGAGAEAAILSFWSTLAVHGMILVPTGIMGTNEIDKTIPQGNTVFGASSLASNKTTERPSKGELHIAALQGFALAKAAKALKTLKNQTIQANNTLNEVPNDEKTADYNLNLKKLDITLPIAPAPVGSYKPYKIVGKLVFINQIALKNGKVEYPGLIGKEVTEEQAKLATKQTLLNILAVLKDAAGGDLNQVKQAVQLTGYFYTANGYTKHAMLMNEASNLLATIMGDAGLHTRATIGASSLPMDSPVEIQAIFELK
ncbi:NAD(P)H:quinone oxidoreductase [Pedobacter nototheniae]|uniref:NAD(P)H:quinone oxidoreductase n=1 Tax=Pedobacter nototheniae TaxID=2488994 RepID=UPI00292FE2A6|nr:NAD(P)H:quinone oxidoreductase [Pedobacter nototheniae]